MKKELLKIIIGLILFILGLLIKSNNIWINNILFIISYLILGLEVIIKAIKNIFKGSLFDENFLMSLATIGAFIIGEIPEAVSVMLLYQIGEIFQDYAVDKSKKSITDLMNLKVEYANVYKDNDVIKVNPKDVNVGDIIIVKSGEKVPLDGIVIDGKSLLDTSMLTGESLPVSASINDKIISGCINNGNILKIKVTNTYKDSYVNKILDLVENANEKKSKSENFISKFAKYYTPIVVILAVFISILPPLILNQKFSIWIYRALTFLVVSCPCALVISIPLGFFGGIGCASRNGILIKGSNYLEAMNNVKTIVFDKTGTLTKGKLSVSKINPIGIDKDKFIKLVAHVENYSTHPIAKSITSLYTKKIDNKIVSNVKELSGLGISGAIKGKTILIGNSKLMNENKIKFDETNDIGTVLYVAYDKKYIGYIVITDEIKEDSKNLIDSLKQRGIKTIMLTGDKSEVSTSISKELGIDEVYSSLLPHEKYKKLESILKEKKTTAFVGDGINDAPSIALADVGISMGGLGSDAAIEASDIVIMDDKISKVNKTIDISHKTLKIVKQNIYFAITVKICVLILSAFGISSMWEAVFADVGVSFIAILNSLRALKLKQ